MSTRTGTFVKASHAASVGLQPPKNTEITQLWKITIFNAYFNYQWPCSIAICYVSLPEGTRSLLYPIPSAGQALAAFEASPERFDKKMIHDPCSASSHMWVHEPIKL